MRRWPKGAVLAATAVAAVLAAVTIRWQRQDPLAALPRDPPAAVTAVEERREEWQGRVLLHLALRGERVGEVRFVVSLPDPVPAEPLPVVMLLGGRTGGSRSVRQLSELVGDPGPNAFIGYDWPLPRREGGELEIALRMPALRRAVLSVPGQVDAILAWASGQPWGDGGRVSVLGFSLGGFVAPAVLRLAAQRGAPVRWAILAYAGAPIGAVIAGHPGVKPRWLARPLGRLADLLLRPVEPSLHLPSVHARFLVLRARDDRLIARSAADLFTELTPQPRTVVVIEGDHLGVGAGRHALLEEVVALSRAWLLGEGAIVAAGSGPPADPVGGSTRAVEPTVPR